MKADIRHILERLYPTEEARFYEPMVIGTSPSMADEGAAAILAGTKTATSSALWEYPDHAIPFAGALSVQLDGQGQPHAVVETAPLEIIPFRLVDDAFALAYGEGDRTLAWWRSAMGDWYQASAARHCAAFCEDTPVICEWVAVRRLALPDPGKT